MLCFTIQGAVLIFFVSFYVAYLSLAAFLMTFVIVFGAGIMFHLKNRRLSAQKAKSAAWERRLFDRLTDFLDGFKEVRLNSARSDDLFEDASDVSRVAANIKIRTQAETFKMIVNSQISMYVLLGAVVFVAPTFSDSLGGASISKATTALLFVVGACFGLVQSIPILLNANAAASRIEELETTLRAAGSTEARARSRYRRVSRRSKCATSCSAMSTNSPTPRSRSDRSTSPCSPASWCSSPAATVRANRRSCACCPGSIRPIPARSRSTACASTTITAMPTAA